MNLVTDSPKLK